MDDFLILNITDSKYNYGKLLLDDYEVEEGYIKISERLQARPITRIGRIYLDSVFAYYLSKELKISQFYRINFIRKWSRSPRNKLTLVLQPTSNNLIDYRWNERVFEMVREKCELEHALSWLSTLGGAFSALGDYFTSFAENAGKISIYQLKLALRLGDPSIATRCRLYLSLSLIQKKRFKLARSIIYKEYCQAKSATVLDVRLMNMCRGIWAKLRYDHAVSRKYRQNSLCKRMHKINI